MCIDATEYSNSWYMYIQWTHDMYIQVKLRRLQIKNVIGIIIPKPIAVM